MHSSLLELLYFVWKPAYAQGSGELDILSFVPSVSWFYVSCLPFALHPLRLDRVASYADRDAVLLGSFGSPSTLSTSAWQG